MNSSQQQFIDWVENHIADALGYPVFSIGQEVLFEWGNQVQLAVIDSCVTSVATLDGIWRER